MSLLKCQNLTLGYENKVVVENLSFEVEEGDYLVVLGENGSGKSTLMKTVLSLIKPLGGKIIWSDEVRRNQVGYLPQQTVVQKDFPASVWEVVLSGCLPRLGLKPFFGKAEKKVARRAMQEMGLEGFEKRSYRELSGGQQQRVLLARALCATEKLIVLDEPVSGLDPTVTEEMYQLIKKINDEGVTVIMISHDIHGALSYGNKILRLGKNTFFGSTRQYLEEVNGNERV